MKFPLATFVHIDTPENEISDDQEPNANSTIIDASHQSVTNISSRHMSSSTPLSNRSNPNHSNAQTIGTCPSGECPSNSVGHVSHIPRIPPTPGTYTIPSIMLNKSDVMEHTHLDKSIETEEDLFGMIKLRENDVCYTSGTIEWVGRKRSYPINSGFKLLNDSNKQQSEPSHKKTRVLNRTFTRNSETLGDCDCADMLPTVNAIVDHLNALHEAVDIVDLRLNTLEETMSKTVD